MSGGLFVGLVCCDFQGSNTTLTCASNADLSMKPMTLGLLAASFLNSLASDSSRGPLPAPVKVSRAQTDRACERDISIGEVFAAAHVEIRDLNFRQVADRAACADDNDDVGLCLDNEAGMSKDKAGLVPYVG